MDTGAPHDPSQLKSMCEPEATVLAPGKQEQPMSHDLIVLGLLVLFSLALGALLLAAPRLLGARSSQKGLLDIFECGVPLQDGTHRRMQVRFYLIAIVFIVFDVEAVFLFPWAVLFRDLGMFGFVEMIFFIAVLTLGLVYVWRKGGLEWD